MMTIILNGKKAGIPSVRDEITTLRKEVENVEVHVPYELGDERTFQLSIFSSLKIALV